MTSTNLAAFHRHRFFVTIAIGLIGSVLFSTLSSNFAHAAPLDGTTGEYSIIQLAHYNQFYVYTESGEYVHFRLQDGYYDNPWSGDNGGHAARCANVQIIRDFNSSIAATGSTCNGSNVPNSTTHLKVQNTTNGPMKFRVVFTPETGQNDSLKRCNSSNPPKCDTQGYQWKVWVNNNAGDNENGLKTGRVWVDPENGLRVWQNVRSGNGHGTSTDTLAYHRADLKFVYARKDGYRYLVTYNDFHGIWSEFYSGVYGIFDKAATPNLVYKSIKKNDPAYTVQTVDPGGNNAYLFVDCRGAFMGCTGVQESLGLNDDTAAYPIANSSGAGAGVSGNPIKDDGNYTSNANTTGFRFTGYSTAGNVYSGGTITVPYTRMQSGYINIWLRDETAGNSLLPCQRNPQNSPAINDVDGAGDITWNPTCLNGINSDHVIRIYAQAIHLGEMHFINTDVEYREGITVQGNGLYANSNDQYGLIYNDPFSTSGGSMCGTLTSNYKFGGSKPGFRSNNSATTDPGVNRTWINSKSSVHGWRTNNCDNTTGAGTNTSVWGNDRNIEDWVYSFKDPDPRSFAIGGALYDLTPTAHAAIAGLSPGQPATFTYNVANSALTSNATNWSIRSVVIAPGTALPADYFDGFDGSGRDCASYYKNGRPGIISCDNTATDINSSGTQKFTAASTDLTPQTIPQSYPVGTRICRSLTVDSRNQDPSPNLRTSTLECALVGVIPSLQVWGSDVRVGSGFVTGDDQSSSVKSLLTFVNGSYKGSWGEYGVTAPAEITNFASGSGLNVPLATSLQSDWSKLTFANTSFAGTFGNFASSNVLGQIPDVKTYLTNAAAKANLTIKSLNGPQDINGYQADTVYIVNGDVTIRSDIKNTSVNVLANLKQMVIIANNIYIDPSVGQVDAWLIAPGGKIDTCVMAGDQRLSTSDCNKFLKINGPLMADSVVPRRTSGGGTDPAEVLDLRGDAYMWARKVSEANGSIHTTYLRELPPRY